MAKEPPPDTYWTKGRHLEQYLMIEGHPAAIVYPALNRAEILPANFRAAQTIAAPWSVSPFDLVEQHFDFKNVRIVPTSQDDDLRARVKEANENFRSFVSRDQEARRSLTDAIMALKNHARHSEPAPNEPRSEALRQLERAVQDIDVSAGQWNDSAHARVLVAIDGLKTANPQSPEWHAWLECQRALTADHLYRRDAPNAQIEQAAPEAEQTFDAFERDERKPDRDIGPEIE